jgi:hypothetical protein
MELTLIMLDLDRHNLPSYFGCAICSDSFFAGGLLLIVGNVTSNGKMVSVLVLFFLIKQEGFPPIACIDI